MVTHDPSAAAMADRVVFFRDGEVAGEVPGGSTDRVMEFFSRLQPPLGDEEERIAGGTAAGAGVR